MLSADDPISGYALVGDLGPIAPAGHDPTQPWTPAHPAANEDSLEAVAGTALRIPVLANDAPGEGATLELIAASDPAHGTAQVVTPGDPGYVAAMGGPYVLYTPQPGYTGGDSFVYTAANGYAQTSFGQVNVTLRPPGTPPGWGGPVPQSPTSPGGPSGGGSTPGGGSPPGTPNRPPIARPETAYTYRDTSVLIDVQRLPRLGTRDGVAVDVEGLRGPRGGQPGDLPGHVPADAGVSRPGHRRDRGDAFAQGDRERSA